MLRMLIWFLPLSILAMALLGVPSLMLDEQGLPRYKALQSELSRLQRVNKSLRKQLIKLKKDVHALKTDTLAIEKIARDELGMVQDDELIFNFEE